MDICSIHFNPNFAYHFLIHRLLQNAANKSQYQNPHQREARYDIFKIFAQLVTWKKCQKGELNTYIMQINYVLKDFLSFSLGD